MKEWLKNENGQVINCARNISQMNILEYIWYWSEFYGIFGENRKPNIGWTILFLWCPWINEIWYSFKREGFLNITVSELAQLFLILIFTLLFLGPIFCIVFAALHIKEQKKLMKRSRKI